MIATLVLAAILTTSAAAWVSPQAAQPARVKESRPAAAKKPKAAAAKGSGAAAAKQKASSSSAAAPITPEQKAKAEALSQEATGFAQRQQFAEAEKLWLQALELNPALYSALFNLGFMHYSRGNFEAAIPFLSKAGEVQPEEFNTHYVLGAALARVERNDEALHAWRKAVTLRSDHVRLMTLMAVEYGKGRYFSESRRIALQALELQDTDPNLWFIALKAYQDDGDHPGALELTTRLTEKFPNLARANFEHGFELYRAARPAEALPYIRKAMEMESGYEEPFFFYGEILMNEGRYEEALPPLRKAVAIKPDYISAWVGLARALMRLEKYDQAVAELEHAVAADPRHPQPHLLLSQLYFRLGEEEKAAEAKQLSLRLRRENPTAMEIPVGRPFAAELSRR
jgi:tetratricopeptide (TPR) repeat protein